MAEASNKGNKIILIGPMGAGKTTVGRQLAGLLHWDFRDIDQELEKATGVSVNLIFEIEKEAGFRLRETQMLEQLLQHQDIIIATGGGIVTRSENRHIIAAADALVIYLKLGVSQQLRRLQKDKSRPLLQTPDRRNKLRELASERNPLYRQLADLCFTSNHSKPHAMARLIQQQLSQQMAAPQ